MNTPTDPELLDAHCWRVLKFGGTSVTGRERMDVIAGVVRDRDGGCDPVVVVSAQAGVTNLLAEAARAALTDDAADPMARIVSRHEEALAECGLDASPVAERVRTLMEELDRLVRGIGLVGECSPRTLDQVLSIGERASVELVAGLLSESGIEALAVDAASLVVTDDRHGGAVVDFAATGLATAAAPARWDGAVPVITGFLGATATGERTTLGRGGSDYSAAVVGWALGADRVEIWTDVDGVMTADPRQVPEARPLRSLSYAELLELSHWGARVLHPKTVGPLRERGIPLVIRNTARPEDPGTRVVPEAEAGTDGPVRGVASIDSAALIQLNGVGREGASLAGRLLHAIDDADVTPLIVSQGSSERSVCVALPGQQAEVARMAIEREFALERQVGLVEEPIVEADCAVVAVVGAGMRNCPGIAGRVFGVLGRSGVNVRAIAQGSSELNISLVVRADDAARALRDIHSEFFSQEANR